MAFDDVRRRRGGELAIVGPETLTYDDLWRLVLRWLSALSTATVPAGAPIAVLLPRSADLVAAQLACWHLQRPYLPLDPSMPDPRIHTILNTADCNVVLTSRDWRSRPPATATTITPTTASTHSASPIRSPQPDDIAYLICTSGSTGVPKLVAITHGSLANLVGWHRRTYGVGPGSVCTMLAGLGFDASVWETWSTLATGAALAVPAGDSIFDVAAIVDFYTTYRVTQSFLSTPLFEELLTSRRSMPDTLQTLLTGGDRLRLWPRADFVAGVFNHYGPAEATVVTTATADLRSNQTAGPPPIGRPIDGVRCEVQDDRGRLIRRPGVAGELWIGGAGVAVGYHHDPARTAESFHARSEDGRWYQSGDICQWTNGGELEFIGRRDRQVKIRGNRVEIADVEAALLSLPGVRQAAAVLRDDAGPAPLLAAYVVASGVDHADRIREQMSAIVPGYMVPAVVESVEALPLTPNGKVDIARLRSTLPRSTPDVATAPVDPVTRIVLDVMSEVLDGSAIGPDDDFFAVGGHSILAARVANELRARLAREVPVATVLGELTARRIAAALGRTMPGSGRPHADAIIGAWLNVTGNQRYRLTRVWDDGSATQTRGSRLVPLRIRVRGPLDLSALRTAVGRLPARHPALRTSFRRVPDGRFEQRVDDWTPTELTVLPDAPALVSVERTKELTTTPFDLTKGGLLRAAVWKTGPDEHELLLVTDHLACDGFSVRPLVRSIADEYGLACAGTAIESTDGYLSWLSEHLALLGDADRLAAHERFWRETLTGVGPFPPVRIPPLGARGGVDEPGRRELSIPHDTVAAVTATFQVSLYMVFAMCAVRTLHRLTGDTDYVLHAPVSLRTTTRGESAVGWMSNVLPMRYRSGDTLAEIKTRSLSYYAHAAIPLEAIIRATDPQRYRDRPDRVFVNVDESSRPRAAVRGLDFELVGLGGSDGYAGISLSARRDAHAVCVVVQADPRSVTTGFLDTLHEELQRQLTEAGS